MDRYKEKVKVNNEMAPFMLPENDPDYIKRRPKKQKYKPLNLKVKRKPNKVLTNLKRFAKILSVNNLKRKGDKMATDNKQPNKKDSKGVSTVKSVAWLLLAVQQGFVGYVLLANFSNYFVVAAALLSLGIAGVVVVAHFVKAHK